MKPLTSTLHSSAVDKSPEYALYAVSNTWRQSVTSDECYSTQILHLHGEEIIIRAGKQRCDFEARNVHVTAISIGAQAGKRCRESRLWGTRFPNKAIPDNSSAGRTRPLTMRRGEGSWSRCEPPTRLQQSVGCFPSRSVPLKCFLLFCSLQIFRRRQMRQSGNQNLEGKMPDFTRKLENALYNSAASKVRTQLALSLLEWFPVILQWSTSLMQEHISSKAECSAFLRPARHDQMLVPTCIQKNLAAVQPRNMEYRHSSIKKHLPKVQIPVVRATGGVHQSCHSRAQATRCGPAYGGQQRSTEEQGKRRGRRSPG